MHRRSWNAAIGLVLALLTNLSATLRGDESGDLPKPVLALGDTWSCVLAGQTVPVRCHWSEVPANKRVVWELTFNNRKIAQGAAQLTANDERRGNVDLLVEVPPLHEEVSLDVVLEVATADKPRAAGKALRVLATDPFAGRKLAQLSIAISLFDPENSTQHILEQAGYACKRLRSVAAIDSVESGVVVVGQGVTWSAHRGLAEAVYRRASLGTSVLCLAPADGPLNVLATEGPEHMPGRLLLAGNEIIKEYDSRLDAEAWAGGNSVAKRFAWQAAGHRVTLAASLVEPGWQFVSIRPQGDEGRQAASCVLCGYDLVGRWNDGPVPRYLLAAIISALASESKSQPINSDKASDR
jgi:hypothetical protein